MKFVFDTDWMESLKGCSAEVRLEVYEAVIRYAASGTLSNLKPTAKLAFRFIKSQIDSGSAYSSMMKELGKKGAQKRWGIAANSDANSGYIAAINEEKEEIPTEKVTQKELPEEEKEQEKDIDKSISKKNDTLFPIEAAETQEEKVAPKRRRFVKPTEEEVAAYCLERKNNISATQFINFYESKGWMVGSNPMKDWKAAVRTWEQGRSRGGNTSYTSTTSKSTFVPLPTEQDYINDGGFQV